MREKKNSSLGELLDMLSACKPRPGVVRDRPSRFGRDFKSAARAARASSWVDSEKSIQIHSGSRLAFGVLSRTSLLLATVFGRDAIEDSVDERQRLSVRLHSPSDRLTV